MLQFNVLADGLSGFYEPDGAKKVFVGVDRECLNWSYRGPRILEEVNRHRPDIITFQEMDQINYFKRFLVDYECEYFPNTKKSPCLKVGQLYNHKLLPDGVAIFFLKKKFKFLGVRKFDEDKPIEVAGMLVHLGVMESKREIIVGTVHLKSAKDTEGEKIRLKQLSHFLPEARKFQEIREKEKKKCTFRYLLGVI